MARPVYHTMPLPCQPQWDPCGPRLRHHWQECKAYMESVHQTQKDQAVHHSPVKGQLSLQLQWDTLAATESLASTQEQPVTIHGRLLVE